MANKPKPPRLAQRLLASFLRDDLAEEVSGDLDENFYALVGKKSPFNARLNYWYQVLHYLRPFALRKSKSSTIHPTIMVRHNFILTYRNFKRYKSSFLINLIGLSTGLACTFLIYLWVGDELSVDKFNEKDNRLFRAMEHRIRAENGIWTSPTTPGPLAEALAADMPEVEYAITATWPQPYTLSLNDKNITATGRFTGKDFFNMFSYELIAGDAGHVLTDKNSVVISDALALKLFNTTENIVGKAIDFQHESSLQVSGIFKSMPINASDQFDFVGSFEKLKEGQDWLLSWGNTGIQTLVLLKPGVNVGAFNEKIADYIKVKTKNEITYRTLFLKGYSENYLYGKYENGIQVGGRITYVKLFSLIAAFILLIACINFMNLSTAKASRRVKEVGVKKAIGAGRKSLIFQYLSESLFMSMLSLLVAMLLVYLLLGQFNMITGKHLSFHLDFNRMLLFLGVTVFTGLVAGSYPALYISGFNPAVVLKGKFSSSFGELMARKGLVVFQFAISILFIVSVLVVYKQIEFLQSTNLGYNKNNVIYFGLSGALGQARNREAMIEEMKRIPGVEHVSSTNHDMTGHNGGTYGVEWEGKNPDDRTEFERVMVNYDLLETLGFQIAQGRSFSREFGTDSSGIIFNQKGIDFMGMKDPIGKTVKLWGQERHIVGVVKDFHYESLHENFKPVFFVLAPNDTYRIMARITAGKEKETLSSIQSLYQKLNPGFSFEYNFLDIAYQSQYENEQRVAVLSKYFAGLAILISCLGLFGLAAFTAERRLKEIGIRKVLGSSELRIVYLLSGDFTKIVLVAIVLALPVSYFLTTSWLNSFAFKIPLQPWYFIGAALVSLVIAWLTVGVQAIKAARINPTKCLKNE
jgi:putative ABC transport system permease protein